ncbi:hypothetical protein K6L44_09895 [Gluconacetobacter entanii]|uniref:hypothetical protein n=1 Tax=Gluconacetobacter entanii TaxID=108528 RepID=UPI001C932290|nr:hypothetical protein [Gluconacetobacter entanii]MBY4640291.1 hypothetical protein [Gluconacetobacter entanii]MCW4579935.1 hypothetical protein [Gluconacetobacter entanii]MCW4584648.1 hypothetical protein [Gluconacetobacter entanii]MCW4588090.1 hypothetical protein [Gluconacetobacter entanii]
MTRKSETPREDETGADVALALKDEAAARKAFAEGVAIRGKDGGARMVPPGHVIIVCRDPGMRRAGIEHKALHVWRRGELTRAQIDRIAADTETFAVIEVG